MPKRKDGYTKMKKTLTIGRSQTLNFIFLTRKEYSYITFDDDITASLKYVHGINAAIYHKIN